ncbi:MAG: hypothetical protein KDA96_06010 [Planctomycetaceae bacterium]|nr:hypothetical protein [Planctomycetaceae bacterium]
MKFSKRIHIQHDMLWQLKWCTDIQLFLAATVDQEIPYPFIGNVMRRAFQIGPITLIVLRLQSGCDAELTQVSRSFLKTRTTLSCIRCERADAVDHDTENW